MLEQRERASGPENPSGVGQVQSDRIGNTPSERFPPLIDANLSLMHSHECLDGVRGVYLGSGVLEILWWVLLLVLKYACSLEFWHAMIRPGGRWKVDVLQAGIARKTQLEIRLST